MKTNRSPKKRTRKIIAELSIESVKLIEDENRYTKSSIGSVVDRAVKLAYGTGICSRCLRKAPLRKGLHVRVRKKGTDDRFVCQKCSLIMFENGTCFLVDSL